MGGVPTYTDFDNAKRICREVDAYFVPARKKKQIAMLGQDKVLEDIWLWYDAEAYYLTAESIKNILDIRGSKLKLSTVEKKALHQKELIKVHKKADDSLEYTVHYQRPLYCDYKTKKRFVAFNREKCKEYNLFENLENFCTVPQLAKNTTQEENTTVDNSAFAEHLKSILAQNRTN